MLGEEIWERIGIGIGIGYDCEIETGQDMIVR
jgi:hypothetical protein